jgi:hypothetical protein
MPGMPKEESCALTLPSEMLVLSKEARADASLAVATVLAATNETSIAPPWRERRERGTEVVQAGPAMFEMANRTYASSAWCIIQGSGVRVEGV